ncbi:Unknown protein sequence [Pseudomonas syringae pv. syringae]|nr:Unknown protein sequence [Pseudomonas syringae pv. syringae]
MSSSFSVCDEPASINSRVLIDGSWQVSPGCGQADQCLVLMRVISMNY